MKELSKEIKYLKLDLEDIKKWVRKFEELEGRPEQEVAREMIRECGLDLLGVATAICELLDEKTGASIYD